MSRLECESHVGKFANDRACDRPLSNANDAWSRRIAQNTTSAANEIRIDIRKSKFKIFALDNIAWIDELTELYNDLTLVLAMAQARVVDLNNVKFALN
jgi:hypothetical protein